MSDKKQFSLLDFLIQWVIRVGGASLFIHECGHLVGASLIGLYAEMRTTNLTSVFPDPTAMPLSQVDHWIFYGAGGIIQCLFFLAFNLKNNDSENRMVNTMVAIHGLIYAVFEAMAPKSQWGFGGLLGSVVGFAVFFLFLLWRKPEIVGWKERLRSV